MNDDSVLGGVLNQLGQTAKQAVKQAVKIPEEMVADLSGQIGAVSQRPGPEGQAKSQEKPAENLKQQWQSDEERVKFLRGLYGSDKNANPNLPADKKPTEFQEQIKDKSPEEQKKLIELRNQLHKDFYYNPTFNPVKKQDEQRPAEKVEKEKKQEMQELEQKEAKKPPPLAVVREQNKAEMFRGASG